MRFSLLLWISVVASGPMPGQAGLFGTWGAKNEEAETIDNNTSGNKVDTPKNSQTIHSIIEQQRRHVLYNSRRLTGECIDVCVTKPPKNDPPGGVTNDPTSGPTKNPTKGPSSSPTAGPSKNPTAGPSSTPTKAPITTGGIDCDSLKNFGFGFSEATGSPHYTGACYPSITTLKPSDLPGRDDSVAVFAGGDFTGVKASEVEGKVVVLGNLMVAKQGPGNFVSVGGGTHVIPNSGGDCIIVGGDLIAQKNVQVFNQDPSMFCDIVYKGSSTGTSRWKTNGVVKNDPNYDLIHYEQMQAVLLKKSKHWKTLPANGIVSRAGSTTTFECDPDQIQVFSIDTENSYELKAITEATSYQFTSSCEDKTILINVLGTGSVAVNAAAMYDFNNRKGFLENGFSTCMTQNILWNFPDFTDVDIGNGKTSEFHGSLLVSGNLNLSTTGHSGRVMVVGNIVHNKVGSEFHSYPYNPPTPLPDPNDICEIAAGWQTSTPTASSTNSPTITPPAIAGCKMKPNNVGVTNDSCKQCADGHKWWPCDMNPPLCEGEDCIFNIST